VKCGGCGEILAEETAHAKALRLGRASGFRVCVAVRLGCLKHLARALARILGSRVTRFNLHFKKTAL
jgi:hypothetical protein